MKTRSRLHTLAAAALAVAALAPMNTPSHATPATPATASCPAILQHRFDRLQDEKPQDLCQYAGQVVLVINTASYCGFTQQYKGLEELYRRYRDRGLVVLGFPSNDFGQQEPGSSKRDRRVLREHLWRAVPDVCQEPRAWPAGQCPVPAAGRTHRHDAEVELLQVPDQPRRPHRAGLQQPHRLEDLGSLRRDIERLLGS